MTRVKKAIDKAKLAALFAVEEPKDIVEDTSPVQSRFKDLDWFVKDKMGTATVGGLGGIGSWLCLFLGRLGMHLKVYEYDRVENLNQSGQLFGRSHIGMEKTLAASIVLGDFALDKDQDKEAYPIETLGMFKELSTTGSITFVSFDNMAARKAMFESWVSNPAKVVFIDGRMAAESFVVYVVTPEREEAYRATLFDDSEAVALPCAAKATSHCGAMAAAMMTSLYTNFLSNKRSIENGTAPYRDVPFATTMHLPFSIFTVEHHATLLEEKGQEELSLKLQEDESN